jgi:Zn-dependent peptidase ImmA (M78 family)
MSRPDDLAPEVSAHSPAYNSVRSIGRRLASLVRRRHLRSHGDGVSCLNLPVLAHAMGVKDIRREDLVEDGRLEASSDRVTIYVRSHVAVTRERFTIAHELGHLSMLDEDLVKALALERPISVMEEERLCDGFAAGLLMPPELLSLYRRQPVSLSTARRLADHAGVSISAAMVELKQQHKWTTSLIRWQRRRVPAGVRWVFASSAALPPALFGRVSSTAKTSSILHELAYQGGYTNSRSAVLPVHVAGLDVRTPAEVLIIGSSAFAFVDLPFAIVASHVLCKWPELQSDLSEARRLWNAIRRLFERRRLNLGELLDELGRPFSSITPIDELTARSLRLCEQLKSSPPDTTVGSGEAVVGFLRSQATIVNQRLSR